MSQTGRKNVAEYHFIDIFHINAGFGQKLFGYMDPANKTTVLSLNPDLITSSVTAMKQMLNDNENMGLSDALANEQKLFQGVAGTKEGIQGMKRFQERFDAGETTRDVYGLPRD